MCKYKCPPLHFGRIPPPNIARAGAANTSQTQGTSGSVAARRPRLRRGLQGFGGADSAMQTSPGSARERSMKQTTKEKKRSVVLLMSFRASAQHDI
eukprot:1896937-Pyramimonas_sp.AAC.1